MLEHAQGYLKLGWHVIPINWKKKHPPIKWKPYQTRLPTQSEITGWWIKFPNSNVGIITGPGSGICSLDIDSPEARQELWNRFNLPDTIIQETGRGHQYLFQYPNTPIKSQAGIIHNVDFKGENGIIVLPPSIHSTGATYKWTNINPIEDGLDDLLPLPPDLEHFIRNGGRERPQDPRSPEIEGKATLEPPSIGQIDPDWVNKILMDGIAEGKRDDMMYKLACKFVREDRPKDQIVESMLFINLRNRPPLPETDIRRIAKSAEKYRGRSKFEDFTQKKISNFTKVISPIGKHFWRMAVEGKDGTLNDLTLQPTQLYTSRLFAIELMTQTNVVMDAPKQKDWNKYIESLINNQEVKHQREDETDLDYIREQVVKVINKNKGKEYDAKEAFVKDKPIIDGENLIVKLKWVDDLLRRDGRPMHQKEVGRHLRALGLKKDKYSDVRIWKGEYAKFQAGLLE